MYGKLYDDINIRNRNYNIQKYILEYYDENYMCLDLGCGSCRKIIPLCDKVLHYYAIDNNPKRISTAKRKCKNISNITLGVGDNYYLPFENSSFDLVSCFMTKYSIGEIYRVLKDNGILIIETAGANDKRDLRKAFGKDSLGWRGKMLPDTSEERKIRLMRELSPFFKLIDTRIVKFETRIPLNKFIKLTRMTHDIRNFGKYTDIKTAYMLRDEDGNIKFEEEKIILISRKY